MRSTKTIAFYYVIGNKRNIKTSLAHKHDFGDAAAADATAVTAAAVTGAAATAAAAAATASKSQPDVFITYIFIEII